MFLLLGLSEALTRIRERIAKVESSHESLDKQFSDLNTKVDNLNVDISRKISESHNNLRTELTAHSDSYFNSYNQRLSEVSENIVSIRTSMKNANNALLIFLSLAGALLGWGEFGDIAWNSTQKVLHIHTTNVTVSQGDNSK